LIVIYASTCELLHHVHFNYNVIILALISFGHELGTSIRFKIKKKSWPLQSYYRDQAEVTIHVILITNTTKNLHKVKATIILLLQSVVTH
jgi:hypothetical protein